MAQARCLINYNHLNIPFVKHDWHFWRRVSPGLMVCIIISCLCSIFMCGIAPKLQREFAWALYQGVSPVTKVQRRYRAYQVCAPNFTFTQATPYLYHFADLPCFPQVHALLRLCLCTRLRHHQRSLYSTRVSFDLVYHTCRPSASGFCSLLYSEREKDWDVRYLGKSCACEIGSSLTLSSSFMQP